MRRKSSIKCPKGSRSSQKLDICTCEPLENVQNKPAQARSWTFEHANRHKMSRRKPLKPEVGHLSMRTARKCPEAPQASKQTGSAARKSTIKCPKQAYSNLPNPAVRTLRIQITKKIQKNMLSNQIMYLQRQNLVLTFDYNWEEKWHKY